MDNKFKNIKKDFNLKDVSIIYVFSIILYFILSLIVSAILNEFLPKGEELNVYFSKKSWYPIVSFSPFPISFVLVTLLYCLFKEKNIVSYVIMEEKPSSKIDILLCTFLSIFLVFGLSNVNGLFIEFINKITNYKAQPVLLPDFSFLNFVISFVFVCVIPAICEEILFRKFLLNSLKGLNLFISTLLIGLLFSLFHFNLSQTLFQFIMGCIFVIVVKATKSTYTSIFMHFLNNFIVLVCYYINPNLVVPIWIVIISIILSLLIIIYFAIKAIRLEQREKCPFKSYYAIFIPIAFTLVLWVMLI